MEKEMYREELKIFVQNGTALLGAYILKRVTEKVLETVFEKVGPDRPHEELGWIEAVGWAAFTGAMAGALKLVLKKSTNLPIEKIR
jgi:hypothetical protein